MSNNLTTGFLLTCLWVLRMLPAQADTESHILLQDSPLAGFQYHQGKALWHEMQVGDRLDLKREPENRYDARAVRVEWRGQKLGYVPRRENADIARLMDNGARLEARITRLTESRDPWQRVRFEIVLPLE
ncbi:MAG: HIRAN domain-containing protein [Hydrogenophilaceae bacterium]|nr:HIRAN domain-containing protein [Hydrogenophilaceae bacterium]